LLSPFTSLFDIFNTAALARAAKPDEVLLNKVVEKAKPNSATVPGFFRSEITITSGRCYGVRCGKSNLPEAPEGVGTPAEAKGQVRPPAPA